MLLFNPDLINSCRVCRSPNQDGDYQCLYKFLRKHGKTSVLSEAGILYENLLNISLNTHYCYPQYLCNSCDLQMKLFKKLKDKAYKSLEYMQNLYGDELNKTEGELCSPSELRESEDYPAIVDESKANNIEDYQEDVNDEYASIIGCDIAKNTSGDYHEDALHGNKNIVESDYDECAETLSQKNNENEYWDIEEPLPASNNETRKEGLDKSLTGIVQQEEIKIEFLEESKNAPNLNDISEINMVVPLILIDKNDYITEIYELLEDDSKMDTYSENNENVKFEEKSMTGSELTDVEYVVEEICSSSDEVTQEMKILNTKKRGRKYGRKMVNGRRKKEYNCELCETKYPNIQEYKLHITQLHDGKYACNVCSKELKSIEALSNHMKLHNDQPAYQCEICEKTFNQKCHYQYHMNHHNNIRNFKCNLCEKAFISNADLKVHLRFHSGQRPYVCNICGKDYLMMEHLKTHLLTHTEQSFQCETCKRKFSTHKTLRLHVRTIHEDEPKFKCSFCLKQFRRKHHLEYHLKLHQKNVQYLDSHYEEVDDPSMLKNESNFNTDFLDGEDSIHENGFIALNELT